MENQHRKINGYRELSQEEIDLMNRIKAKGTEMLELQAELVAHIKTRRQACVMARVAVLDQGELDRMDSATIDAHYVEGAKELFSGAQGTDTL